ncbi:lytic transglycosylase domain-containing protein [Rhizobium sp. CSW-27]|uniref:lytic transglycosylase domain-containing protein n=1 Tax=Rhizobium sp. CSW-27 TaxID=2839985 RepID=UPI0020784E69|nr:lytic transglycosylase domain-containing protein [Rhizobium sp. CSW-27]
MAITRFFGCNAVIAVAICGAVSSCSSVDSASNTAADGKAEQSQETAQAKTETTEQLAEAHAAPKSGRISIEAAAAAAGTDAGPVAAPAGSTTVVAEKGGRVVHQVALPVGSWALARQNDSVRAALAEQAAQAAGTTPALAVAPTSLETTGAMQAINVATAAHVMSAPVAPQPLVTAAASPVQVAHVAVPQPKPVAAPLAHGIPEELSATYVAIPTPRPKMAQAPTSSMLAYASASQPVSSLTTDFFPPAPGAPLPETAESSTPELNKLIKRYAGLYGVPESLVHRVVHRESKYNPKAYNRNGYFGLMQIKYSTAKAMGYRGPAEGLLDAETNLKYAIKYLRGAWLVADNEADDAIGLYARGYYYDAKRKDMLHVMH